jgi:glycosyltransferase involved in cell wall biosynthesis
MIMISVIIPAYNRAKLLTRAIQSVLSQTYQDFEIIVVDDFSKDNTDELMQQYHDTRIRYIKHSQNKGGNAARNTGIKQARGEFIAFLDSDDEWLPEKLEKQIALIKQSPEQVGLIFSSFKIINLVKKTECVYSVNRDCLAPEKILIRNFIGTFSVVLVKKKLLEQVNGLDETLMSCQDWDLYVRLRKVCEFDYIDEPLVNYYSTRSKTQISHNREAVVQGYTRIFEKNKTDFDQLSVAQKIDYFQFIGCIFVEVGSYWKGVTRLSKSFLLDKTIANFIFLLKGMAVGIIIKIGLGNVYFYRRSE